MNAVVPFTPIPVPSNPAQLPSLPGWLLQRSGALGSATQPDETGRHREMTILPRSLILNSSERAEVQRHIDALSRFTSLEEMITIRETTISNAAAHATMIAGILLKGGKRMDQQSSDQSTEDYLDAIEDLPAWSVREAIRRWNRAESIQLDPKKPHDFNWRPEPPTLRRLALHELAGVKGRLIGLQKLLDAVPLVEYSDEHRKSMIERLQVVIHNAANPAPIEMPADHGAREAAE